MLPIRTTVTKLFESPYQYQIPIFQRGYVWTLERQVVPLWADIQSRADAELDRQQLLDSGGSPATVRPVQKHFLGSIVMTPVQTGFGRVPVYEVIDGQQRSTTLQLLLIAFRHAAQLAGSELLPPMLAGLLRNPGPYAAPEDHCKVWPTQAGRDEMKFLSEALSVKDVCETYLARDGRRRLERPLMVQAFLYLHNACLAYIQGHDLNDPVSTEGDRTQSDALVSQIRSENDVSLLLPSPTFDSARAQALYVTLSSHMQIMTLALEADDDPQVIFETLNARGEPLLASDLIRNFVFLEAARNGSPVPALYEKFWSPFDLDSSTSSGKSANRYWRERERQGRLTYPRLDLFFYNYAILRSQEVTLASHVFQAFKVWWQKQSRDLESELSHIVAASGYFRKLVSPEGTDYLAEFSRLVRSLDVGTVTPVYLALRERLDADSAELKQALSDLASFLSRRAVCGLTTKGYNRFFMRVLIAVAAAKDEPQNALRQALLGATASSELWPDDEMFTYSWLHRPVYTELKPAKVCGLLRALEYAARGAMQASNHVPAQWDLTVEHVLPQSWEKLSSYQIPGMTAEQRQLRFLAVHGFGNLTLLTQPLNSSVSNGPFADWKNADGVDVLGKRSRLGQSALLLNTYFQKSGLSTWDDSAIAARAIFLCKAALQVWQRPTSGNLTPALIASALSGN